MNAIALDHVVGKATSWSVATQLARREGVRIIRHPIFLIGALISIATFGLFTWQSAPVLHRDDVFVAGSLLPLAAATLIAANLASSRAARHATTELYAGTITSGTVRAIGHLLSLAYPVIASSLVAVVMFTYMLLDAPVGTPRIAEVLVGPFCVALMGAIGIAIGRWKAHPSLGPMAIVAVTGVELLLIQPVVSYQGTGGQAVRSPWFAPWVPMGLTGQVPPELVIRPAGWHLLFLTGLVVFFAAVAIGRDRRGPLFAALVAVGIAAFGLGSIGQLRAPSDADRAALLAMVEHPEDHQVCEERDSVTYCAYPVYAGWIDRWAAPVEGALALIPPEARPQDLVIRQLFGSYFEGPTDLPAGSVDVLDRRFRRVQQRHGGSDHVFFTGGRWGRWATEGEYEIGLSLYVGMTALDFPASRADMTLSATDVEYIRNRVLPTLSKHNRRQIRRELARRRQNYCYTHGQARALAAWWIAAAATPDTRAAVIRTSTDTPYGLQIYEHKGRRIATYFGHFVPLYPQNPPPMWDRVGLSGDEYYYAAALLNQPDQEVSGAMKERWSELIDPDTTTASMIDDLDLKAHPTLEEQIAALPDDVDLEQGHRSWDEASEYMSGLPCR